MHTCNHRHYAYVPPRSAQPQVIAPQALSHAQSGPARRAQGRDDTSQNSVAESMPPPPIPAVRVADPRLRKPPATPRLEQNAPNPLPPRPSFTPPIPQSSSGTGSQRFVPQTPNKAPLKNLVQDTPRSFKPALHYGGQQTQRFHPAAAVRLPAASTSSGSLSAGGLVSQNHSRSSLATPAGSGGQRTPFVPGERFS